MQKLEINCEITAWLFLALNQLSKQNRELPLWSYPADVETIVEDSFKPVGDDRLTGLAVSSGLQRLASQSLKFLAWLQA